MFAGVLSSRLGITIIIDNASANKSIVFCLSELGQNVDHSQYTPRRCNYLYVSMTYTLRKASVLCLFSNLIRFYSIV